jgi:hypothetical protein
MGNNYCRNKPLHHKGFVSHSNYTRHITLAVSTFRMLTKHVGLLPHHLLSFSHHHHTSFQRPPHICTSFKHLTARHMAPKSKKTTPAESRKPQASNADQQPVKQSRHGQNNNDDNQEETAAEQWADFEDQATSVHKFSSIRFFCPQNGQPWTATGLGPTHILWGPNRTT